MLIRQRGLSFRTLGAFERLPKIVVPRAIAPLSPTPEPTRIAVISPPTPIITPIAIEKKRQEIIQSQYPKTDLLRTDQTTLQTKFTPDPLLELKAIDMRIPLGQVFGATKAMPVTRDVTNRVVSYALPKDVSDRMRLKRTGDPAISRVVPLFGKIAMPDIKETPDVTEQKEIISPKAKNLIQTVVPIAALIGTFFLKR